MPIYEYRCDACGADREVIQKISDDPLVNCEACGEPKLRKLMSAAGFRLKGGGWYETDFKNSDRKKNLAGDKEKSASKTDTSAKAGADPKSGDGKDKAAAKTPAKSPTGSAPSSGGGKSGGTASSGGAGAS